MDVSTIDFAALGLGIVVSGVIATALLAAHRGNSHRRAWIMAGGLAVALVAASMMELVRESPRETHLVTALTGGTLPVLGALGMVRATRRVRAWLRWLMVFATALVLLFGGLLLGAAVIARSLRG